MASPARRRAENVLGPFFVDDTCIDCGTCMWMAPETFRQAGDQSAVHTQPADQDGARRAVHALLSCPTGSIGWDGADPTALRDAQADFPLPITADVFHCGYHSRDSFGAASYFVRTPHGNVLVDSPRFAAPLVRQLEALGGVDWLVLTHRDDVADHARFAAHFACRRVIHAGDADAVPDAETVLEGEAPVEVLPGFLAIPVPGHTRGHVAYLWNGTLFGGDHVAWHPTKQQLHAFRGANWYSWPETIRSMEKLREYSFTRVLPGHGWPIELPAPRMREALEACIEWMHEVA